VIEQLIDLYIEETWKHSLVLARKYRQLAYTNDYGVVDESAWQREKLYFARHVLLANPQIASLAASLEMSDDEFADLVGDQIDFAAEHGLRELGSGTNSQSTSETLSNPADFERLCSEMLDELGWQTRVVGKTGDQGVDLVAQKSGLTVAVQCKLYNSPVGNAAVQEVYAGKQHIGADFAVVVSNQSFTTSARQLANTTGVLLLQIESLSEIEYLLPGDSA
jgi:restriction system protein